MPFIGNKVADVAVTVGQGVIDASHIQDASITTADIGNDAITPNKVDDDGTGFQMGSLGLGTAVSGSEKLTVGGTASFSGAITGTLATASQTNITSVGTLTSLTVDDMTFNGSTISDAGAFDIDAGGVIKLDAGGGQIQFFDDGTEIGVLENSSSDFVIESKVQDKDILFKGNDGGTGIELMRMNMSGANVGISTGNSIGAKLHVADNRTTAYSSSGEPNETIIAHNKNGSDGSGVNNYASLSLQVADGATSQGFINYKRTADNKGEFTFSQRTGSSTYAEHLKIENDGTVSMGGALQPGGNLSVGGYAKTSNYFETAGGSGGQQAYSSSVTSSYRGGGLIRFFTDNNVSIFKFGNESSPYGGYFGTFAGYSPSGAELMILGIDGVNIGKNRNSEVIGLRCSTGGTLQSGAGAINATNADNWNLVVKSTTGGTISANGGMGYFALGDNYTTSDAILQVRNDGNRGSAKHASGSSLFKASFNDKTAFEITKDGMLRGMQGASARIAGNWEVIDVLSAKNNQSSYLQSDNCFNDNIYSQFKIVIPYINADTQNATLLFTFMYNSGSGLTEQTGDYYTSMDISPHTSSSYSGGVQSNATRAQIFGAMHGNIAVGVSGEMNIYDAFIADLREYTQFTANTQRYGDGATANDRGSNYRPMIDANLLGYNTDYSAYVSQRSIVRMNTDRHASYWKGFRIQASSGNLGSGSQIIVLGRAV